MLAPLTGRPERAAILCDFDGTLSPLVVDPAEARPLPGAVDTLAALAERYAVVAVISGRPVAFLMAHFHGKVLLSGLYGLESARHGEVARLPEAMPWEPVIAGVAE